MDRERVIEHMQIIRTWASVGKEPIYNGIEPRCCEDVERWMDDALALLREQTQVVRCTGCRYWYRDSGLTARRCEKHGIITKQFDFCSYGEKVQNA